MRNGVLCCGGWRRSSVWRRLEPGAHLSAHWVSFQGSCGDLRRQLAGCLRAGGDLGGPPAHKRYEQQGGCVLGASSDTLTSLKLLGARGLQTLTTAGGALLSVPTDRSRPAALRRNSLLAHLVVGSLSRNS